jgi:alpha-tubulin suppressor-like RCC1 family protein/uncharacterized protein YjdB
LARSLPGLVAWISIAASLVADGCSDGGISPSTDIESVAVSPPGALISAGGTLQLAAHAFDANHVEIPGVQVSWSSDDASIISVSSSGLLTATAAGSATISATAGGKTGTSLISASQQVSTVELTPNPLGLAVGETAQLVAVLSDAQGVPVAGPTPTIIWTSDNDSIGVDADGTVFAQRQGTATITASASGKTASATVTASATPAPIGSLTIQPASVSVAPGGSVRVDAITKDAAGNALQGRLIDWNTRAPGIATAVPLFGDLGGRTQSGVVTGIANGTAIITASSGGQADSIQVTVAPSSAIASIAVSPAKAVVAEGSVFQLTATVRDAAGNPLVGHVVEWTSSGTAATVSESGLVTGVSEGSTVTITAAAEGMSGTTSVAVIERLISFIDLSPNQATFGLGGRLRIHLSALDARGNYGFVQNPDIVWTSANPAVASVSGPSTFASGDWSVEGNSVGTTTLTATATSGGVSATAEVTVTRIGFDSVSAGTSVVCGLSPSGAAFCWGSANSVGVSSLASQRTPVAVAGGLSFVQISAGGDFACGLTAAGAAYCWGSNTTGQLGAGSDRPTSDCTRTFQNPVNPGVCPIPVPVSGGLTFTSVSAGRTHACGLVSDGTAYCWGGNGAGQLGSAPELCTIGFNFFTCSLAPVPVSGGLKFKAIDAGYLHTCAIALDGSAYCWGQNTSGELGTGATSASSDTPVAVTGGLTFTAISAGLGHTCGIIAGGTGLCWGDNKYGQLGDGTTNDIRVAPALVSGGIQFARLIAGGSNTCGVTPAGVEYCWGRNPDGELGSGDYGDRSLPNAVQGGLTFSSISLGDGHGACGIVGQVAYCWGIGGLIGTDDHPAITFPTRVSGQQ